MAKEKTKHVTAKSLILEAVVSGKTDNQIIAIVKKKLPESAVDAKHCTKYRREAFVEGTIEADFAAVKSKEHREWAADNMKAAVKGPHKDFYKEKAAADKAKAKVKKAA